MLFYFAFGCFLCLVDPGNLAVSIVINPLLFKAFGGGSRKYYFIDFPVCSVSNIVMLFYGSGGRLSRFVDPGNLAVSIVINPLLFKAFGGSFCSFYFLKRRIGIGIKCKTICIPIQSGNRHDQIFQRRLRQSGSVYQICKKRPGHIFAGSGSNACNQSIDNFNTASCSFSSFLKFFQKVISRLVAFILTQVGNNRI